MPNRPASAPDHSDTAQDSSAGDELKMRRALGLGHQPATSFPQQSSGHTDRHPHKRRFVRDGEVPVVLVGRRDQPGDGGPSQGVAPVNKLALVEVARRSEQEARQRAERALTEAQATIHDLQTKLGHGLLERDEARDTAQRLEADKRALTEALEAERNARRKAEDALETRFGAPGSSQQVPKRPVGRPPKLAPTGDAQPKTASTPRHMPTATPHQSSTERTQARPEAGQVVGDFEPERRSTVITLIAGASPPAGMLKRRTGKPLTLATSFSLATAHTARGSRRWDRTRSGSRPMPPPQPAGWLCRKADRYHLAEGDRLVQGFPAAWSRGPVLVRPSPARATAIVRSAAASLPGCDRSRYSQPRAADVPGSLRRARQPCAGRLCPRTRRRTACRQQQRHRPAGSRSAATTPP